MAAPLPPQPDPSQGPQSPYMRRQPQQGMQQRYAPANGAPPQQPSQRPQQPVPGQPAAGQPVSGTATPPVTASAPPAPPPVAQQAATPVQNAQDVALASLNNASSAPDRGTLAMQTFRNIQAAGQPAYDQSVRAAASNAAKYGRIGAGQTTNELDDLQLARQRSLDTTSSQLATDAAGQTLSDRLAVAQQALGQYGAYQGADQAKNQLALDTQTGLGNLGVAKTNAETNATSAANSFTLGNRSADTAASIAAANAANQRGTLALDTTKTAQDFQMQQAQQALQDKIQSGQLALGGRSADTAALSEADQASLAKASLAQSGGQFDKTLDFNNVQADRNFALDDRTAAALAALQGTDLTKSGTDANGNPTSATNLPTTTTNGTAPVTPPAGPANGLKTLADSDPQVAASSQQYGKMEQVIAKYGYRSPQGQTALQAEEQARQALASYLANNGGQLSPAQRQKLGIMDNTPGFEQPSTTAQFAPVTG